MTVGDDEELVRALHEPFWDAKTQRASKSAFTQEEVSVSRLAVMSYDEIVTIFQHDLNNSDANGGAGRVVGATAIVAAGFVNTTCAANTLADVVVDIVEDPVINEPPQLDNPSHALIRGRDRSTRAEPRRITPGMASAILKGCAIRIVDPQS